jgi:CBS domain-containing protein
MKIKDLMSHPAVTCPTSATLDAATRLMWEYDCGIVPVIGDDGRLAGVVTDRDACMAAYTTGRPLGHIGVTKAMAKTVIACHANDSIDNAYHLMRENQLHRLPVIDDDGRPVGVLSMNDLARMAARVHKSSVDRELVRTLAAICQPRSGAAPESAAPESLEYPALVK